MPSCSTSAPCRLEWRPSRWIIAALDLLGLLAALSVLASELPRAGAGALAVVVLVLGPWQARRERRRRACSIVIAADGRASVDAQPVQALCVEWRGTLAFLRWRDGNGRMQHRSFWPDTLAAPQRRELRLAASLPVAARGQGGMAH